MRNFDLAPLHRSTVGFDRLFRMLDEPARPDWPPYDVARTGDDAYRITLAVAGYAPGEIDVVQNGTTLLVTGKREQVEDDRFLHRGIPARPFKLNFSLAEHVRVTTADLSNGLLTVELVHEVPETLKPRRIEIGARTATSALTGQGNDAVADTKAA